MTRGSVFLLGGGWNETAYLRTYGRFAAAASANRPARIAYAMLDGEDRDMHYGRRTPASGTSRPMAP